MDLTGRVWPAAHGETVLAQTLGLCAGEVPLPQWLALLRQPPKA